MTWNRAGSTGSSTMVDTALYIADPYSEKVLDPWNDEYINPETYPELIPYPKDTASGIVSVLQTNRYAIYMENSRIHHLLKNKI